MSRVSGKQTVARATAMVMAATVVSKLLGFGREAALAAVFAPAGLRTPIQWLR